MDNRLNLKQYLLSFRTVQEKRKVFYSIFEEMHRYHNNGEYFPKLSFQSISICYTNPTDIQFAYYDKIGYCSIEEVLQLKFQNILQISQMMICAFLEYDFEPPILCLEVLEEKLDMIKNFFHPDDYVYLEKIIKGKEYLYYDDYIRMLDTGGFTEFDEKRRTEGEQAFTTYFLLEINLVVISLLFFCIFLYLS